MTLHRLAETPIDNLIERLDELESIRQLSNSQWQRTYARIEDRRDPLLVLVYEKANEQPLKVEISPQPMPGARRDGDEAWILISSSSDDPALPTLNRALHAYSCEQIVRYRPGKRCTFRGFSKGGQVFVKVLADDRGAQIAADAEILELHREDFAFEIASCVGWDSTHRALCHRAVPGKSIVPALVSGTGTDLAARLGNALASLSESEVASVSEFGSRDQIGRSSKYADKFRKRAPQLRTLIDDFMGALLGGHDVVPDTAHRPIHGSPHPHQWLEHKDRLALVDFDRLSIGPIEIDAATFIAELDFERGGMAAESEAFLSAYTQRAGAIDRRLLTLYRVHKHFSKAFKVALSVEPHRIVRAEQILKGGLARLREALR